MSVVTPKAIARYSHTSLLQLGGGRRISACGRSPPAQTVTLQSSRVATATSHEPVFSHPPRAIGDTPGLTLKRREARLRTERLRTERLCREVAPPLCCAKAYRRARCASPRRAKGVQRMRLKTAAQANRGKGRSRGRGKGRAGPPAHRSTRAAHRVAAHARLQVHGGLGRPEAGARPTRSDGARRRLDVCRSCGLARALVAAALGLVVRDPLDLLAHLARVEGEG